MLKSLPSNATSCDPLASLLMAAICLVATVSGCLDAAAEQPPAPETFTNPIATGADPNVTWDGQRYLWCQTVNDLGVAISVSDNLTALGERHIIWQAPDEGPYSQQVWAPELLKLDGRWYIYFAASNGDNATHLTYVLESKSDDPLGEYQLHGPLYTGDDPQLSADNRWAIDMTVLDHEGRRYAIWSGWTTADSDLQRLYIAPMASPRKIAGPRIEICRSDDYLWERTEETADSRGLNEGPQVLKHAGRTFVVYSCGASWLPTYKLGMLELTGDDPLDPAAWRKFPEPVFRSTAETFGVGHGSFTVSPDGTEPWHAYHAKQSRTPGWQRSIFVQPFRWTDEGLPDFGRPIARGEPLPTP